MGARNEIQGLTPEFELLTIILPLGFPSCYFIRIEYTFVGDATFLLRSYAFNVTAAVSPQDNL